MVDAVTIGTLCYKWKAKMIEVGNIKSINKGAVKFKLDVFIPKWGLTIRECLWMESNGKEWLSFPSRKYEDNGEQKYYSYIFMEKEQLERLREAVKEKLVLASKGDDHEEEVLPF